MPVMLLYTQCFNLQGNVTCLSCYFTLSVLMAVCRGVENIEPTTGHFNLFSTLCPAPHILGIQPSLNLPDIH